MSAANRVKKYRQEGGAADLVRVEVLVPPSARKDIVAPAAPLRRHHRDTQGGPRGAMSKRCGPTATRILDNVDLDRLPELRSRAAVAARALVDRGDARACGLGR